MAAYSGRRPVAVSGLAHSEAVSEVAGAPEPSAVSAGAHNGPARARALAGPSGNGRPRTGTSTTTSTSSADGSAAQETRVA